MFTNEIENLLKMAPAVTRLLDELRFRGQPFDQRRPLENELSPLEYKVAQVEKIRQTSLGDVVKAQADLLGFESVDQMLEAQAKRRRVWPKSVNEILQTETKW